MDEKGKKICEIRTPGYKVIIIDGIIAISALIYAYIKGGLDLGLFLGSNAVVLIIVKLFIDSLKKVEIYEDYIGIHNTIIRYEEIQSIKMIKDVYVLGNAVVYTGFRRENAGRIPNENFLEITLKDGSIEKFHLSHYSFKQNTTLINYIGKFANIDVTQANDFLNASETQDKRELKVSMIIIVILIIIGIFIVWKILMNFKKLGY